jgi:hypothetical protein
VEVFDIAGETKLAKVAKVDVEDVEIINETIA